MKRVLAALLLLAFAVLATVASAVDSTIYPGVGIGKIKLGMDAAQVKKILGRDYLVNGSQNVRGRRYTEWGWDYSRWTVTFEQRGRKLRAVEVATVIPAQRTPKRVGPGSSWRQLVTAYPDGVCVYNHDHGGARADYLLANKSGSQTIFIARAETGLSNPYRVVEVHVRTPWVALTQFQPGRAVPCHRDNNDSP